jgi:hypothetical protein
LLLGGAVVAAVLLGVALRVQRSTRSPAQLALEHVSSEQAARKATQGATADAPGLPPADGGAPPEAGETPFDEANGWANVDLEEVRRAMPDNLYWRLSSPTKDETVLRERDEERARWNEAYGKVLSNTASEQEIVDYYAHRDRLASDYVQFATYVLEHYGEQLSIRDLGLMKVAVELNLATLEQIPRQIEEAQQRRIAHEEAREAWRRDQADFGTPGGGTTK